VRRALPPVPQAGVGGAQGTERRPDFAIEPASVLKRLYTFVETDGCFTIGIAVATGWGVRVCLNLPVVKKNSRWRLEI
jgi:hypothetical protein